MMVELKIDLEDFNFDFWTGNKVRVVNILFKLEFVDSVSELASIVDLSYSSVRALVLDLQKAGVLKAQGRGLMLAGDWQKKFIVAGP